MARLETRYVCGTCGATSLRWEGQCRSCGNWNTLVETLVERGAPDAGVERRTGRPRRRVMPLQRARRADGNRIDIGIREIDRVLGGGLVPGSLVLLGGEPGIGKSTLVLAVCGAVARATGGTGVSCMQWRRVRRTKLRMRAGRLGLAGHGAGEADRACFQRLPSSGSWPPLKLRRRHW